MKKHLFTLFLIGLISFAACGCTNNTTTQTKTLPEQKTVISENPVITANTDFANKLESIFNKGYIIADKTKVYYTKSADFQNVYFVGTMTQKGSQYYNAIWATNCISNNTLDFSQGLIFSINDYAYQVSGMGDGRTNAEPITEHDDGYSRINQKLLNDFDNLIN